MPQLNSLESYHLSETYGNVWHIIDILLCELHSQTASVQFLIMNGMCYCPVKLRFPSRAIFALCFCKTISLKVLYSYYFKLADHVLSLLLSKMAPKKGHAVDHARSCCSTVPVPSSKSDHYKPPICLPSE